MDQIPKCTLVPTRLCGEYGPRCFLSEVASLDAAEKVHTADLPEYDSTLVYAGVEVPELYNVLKALGRCPEHYKTVASIKSGWLHLAVAKGEELLFANVFRAPAFSTAQYFIFNVMKSLQMNLEMSSVYFLSPLTREEKLSMYRYLKSVERI
ncbi:MAG: DUF3822 family protein [Bacteroidales bacterium]|nr:DUF3822 family protein [Bacteroidales bacterium]